MATETPRYSTTHYSEEMLAGTAAVAGLGPSLNLKRLFWLRTPLMLAVAAAVLVPALLAVWFLVPVVYTASADVRFLANTPRVMYSRGTSESAAAYEKFLNTQISLITGRPTLSRVLDNEQVRNLPCLANLENPTKFLEGRVTARVQRNSELATVSCTMPDQRAAELVLNEVVRLYMEYALGEEAEAGGERLRILMKERDARQVELEMQRNQTAQRRREVGLVLPETGEAVAQATEVQQYRDGLLRAQTELSQAQQELADTEASVAQALELQEQYKAAPEKPLFALGIEEKVKADARLAMLWADYARAQANLEHLSTNLVKDSPQLTVEQRRVASLKGSLNGMERTVRGEVLNATRSQLEREVETRKKRVAEMSERANRFEQLIADYNKRAEELAARLAELEQFKAKEAETENLLREVRREITETSLENNAPARVRLASQLPVTAEQNIGLRLQLMALVFVLSLGAGFGTGVLRELTDQQIRSPQDFARLTPLPVIASIPHTSEDTLPAAAPAALVCAEHPNSTSADAFRRVLARLLYPDESSVEINSLLIASPTRGDGKSVLAANVSVALAQAERRVLLIDISGRRPSIEGCFQMERAAGLMEILDGLHTPEELIRATEVENLYILGPGLQSEELASRFASRNMMAFLEWAEESFDHVVVDTPPSLFMSDAKLLAPLMDGVILVVGAGVSTAGMVSRCLREMELSGVNVIGLVLNGLRGTRGGYLRHNLKLYYGYGKDVGNGREEGKPPKARAVPASPEDEPAVVLLPHRPDPFDEAGGESEEWVPGDWGPRNEDTLT